MGIILSWNLIAKKLREETEKYNALTIPQYLHLKYDDKSNLILLFHHLLFFFLILRIGSVSCIWKSFRIIIWIKTNIWDYSWCSHNCHIYTNGRILCGCMDRSHSRILMLGTLVILPIVGFLDFLIPELN